MILVVRKEDESGGRGMSSGLGIRKPGPSSAVISFFESSSLFVQMGILPSLPPDAVERMVKVMTRGACQCCGVPPCQLDCHGWALPLSTFRNRLSKESR